jgi:hypothetical protein
MLLASGDIEKNGDILFFEQKQKEKWGHSVF